MGLALVKRLDRERKGWVNRAAGGGHARAARASVGGIVLVERLEGTSARVSVSRAAGGDSARVSVGRVAGLTA